MLHTAMRKHSVKDVFVVSHCRELVAAAADVEDVDKYKEIASECREQSLPLATDDIVFQTAGAVNFTDKQDNAAKLTDNSDKTGDNYDDKDLSDKDLVVVKFAVATDDDEEPICDKPSEEKLSDEQNLIDTRPVQQPPATTAATHSQLFCLLCRNKPLCYWYMCMLCYPVHSKSSFIYKYPTKFLLLLGWQWLQLEQMVCVWSS